MPKKQPQRPRSSAFTLVEIMVTVVILGFLISVAVPAFSRLRAASQNNRLISDIRTFSQAFESYSAANGNWPASAAVGVLPTGMTGEFRNSDWLIDQASVGGRWAWDVNANGIRAAIALVGVTVPDSQMLDVDAKIDDGNLSTGNFRKLSDRFVWIMER